MSADPPGPSALMDHAADQRQFSLVALALGGTLSLAASLQAVLLLGGDLAPAVDLLVRAAINLIGVAIATALAVSAELISLTGIVRFAVLASCSVVAEACRAGLQLLVGISSPDDVALAESVIAAVLMSVTFVFALQSVSSRRRARESERARLAQATMGLTALAALADEELHMRRELADALHTTLQGRVVMLQVELRALAADLDDAARARAEHIGRELDALREIELRGVSAALYPEGIDRGLVSALRALTSRIPAAIDASLVIIPSGAEPALDLGRRLALARVAEEGVSNALRHGRATRVDTVLHVGIDEITLTVRDDGAGVDPTAARSGLRRLSDLLQGLGGSLELSPTPSGAQLVARMPRG